MIQKIKDILTSSQPGHIKIKQKVFFFGVFGVLTLSVVGGIVWNSSARSAENHTTRDESEHSTKRIKIDSGGSVLNPQEIWVDRLEKEQALLNKRFDQMERLVTDMAKAKLGQGQLAYQPNTDQPISVSASTISDDVNPMMNVLDPTGLNTSPSFGISPKAVLGAEPKQHVSTVSQELNQTPVSATYPTPPKGMQRITFSLDPSSSKKIKRSIDHYVPAGSFARGRLTSGVVAATTVQASGNPQPIHIELTNLGNLPRGFNTDVKQCFLIGSAYGDLSSERVLMRLETLSCVERKTQEIIEMDVDGFVTGEDGANGLRGILVDRSGSAMRNAFVGGFLSGVGNFFGQQQTIVPTTITPGGVASLNPLSTQHVLQGGAGKGVGNAMEKLSDFYIKRAEQLQPVLEIEPGRLVHVVFKKGFDMNQTVYRQSLMNAHDGERRDRASSAGTESTHTPHF